MFSLAQLPRKLSAIKADIGNSNLRVRKDVLKDMRRSLGEESERSERISILQKVLKDEAAELRSDALLALCDYEANTSVSHVIACLRDSEIKVRQMALVAIGELAITDDERALSSIRPFLGASDPSLRYQALVALAQVSPVAARCELVDGLRDSDAEIAALSVRLSGEVSEISWESEPKIVDGLKLAAQHVDHRVRVAAQLLGGDFKIDMPRHEICALVNRTRKPPEPTDELWAIELAYKYDLRSTLPALRRRAYGLIGVSFDPSRFMALVVLCAFGDSEATERAKKQLLSKKIVNRHAVLEAIVSLKLASMGPHVERAISSGRFFEESLIESFRNMADSQP